MLVLTAAFLCNLLVHSRIASVVSWLAIAAIGALILTTKRSATDITAVTLAVAAGSNLVFRSAPVVVVPIWIAANLLLLAAANQLFNCSWLERIRAVGKYFINLVLAIPWLFSAVVQSNKKYTNVAPIIRGLLLAAVVTIPIAALLAEADFIYASVLTPSTDISDIIGHLLVTAVLLVPLTGLALTVSKEPTPPVDSFSADDSNSDTSSATRSVPIEILVILSALIITLGLWCGVQIVVALEGAESIFATANLTRAEYAREGFFQLVSVAAIVILTLWALHRFTSRKIRNGSERQRETLLKVLTGLLVAETLALIGVAYSRLALYIDAFGLTITRLSVAWFLGWLALILLAVAIRTFGFQPKLTVLPFGITSAVVFLTLFGWSNPEATIVSTNISRTQNNLWGDLDGRYLTDLSADAVPTLVENTDKLDEETINRLCLSTFPKPKYGILGWNQANYSASKKMPQICKK